MGVYPNYLWNLLFNSWYHRSRRTIIGFPIPSYANNPLMGDNSVSSEDSLELQDVLDALDDPDCRAILREAVEPMTANELIDNCDISQSTLYRKLDLLSSARLVRERDTINPEGGRTTRYQRDFEDVMISMNEDDTFSVYVERPHRTADERLTEIWSKMGDEL